MSSRGIAVGLCLGALTGIFLGDYAAIFEVVADGFVKLLQMTVLPLVVVSLVGGIGSLTRDQIGHLGRSVGLLVLALWAAGLAAVCLFPLIFPTVVSASFFSTTMIEPRQSFDFVDLYIPANPFRSLANNIVPAVVLFSVVFGVALVGVTGRDRLLEILAIVRRTLSEATSYVVRLTPFGLFAIAASAAGTLTFDQLERIQVYLIAYVAISLLVSFWLLPGLIAAVTPVSHLTVLRTTRNVMVTAFMTSSLFIVLPMLTDHAKALARENGLGAKEEEAADVIVPASFNFPHIGKILTLSFILFAGWFAGAPIAVHDYPRLALSGVLVLFGSVNVAVPFLLDLFRIPADTFQLFLATSVVNSRFGTLMAAMHTLTVAVIGTWMVAGAATISVRRLLRFAAMSVVLMAVVVVGARSLVAMTVDATYEGARVLLGMRLLHGPQRGVLLSSAPAAAPADGLSTLGRVRHRGVLRVGILPDSLPFAFTNAEGSLVGFDVEMANKLARDLDVRLEFVPIAREAMAAALANGSCEIVMSGVVISTERIARMRFSAPYLDETLALVVPDHMRDRFVTWDRARQEHRLRIGAPAAAIFADRIRAELPRAEIVPVASAQDVFGARQFDAVILTAERGSAWTLLHPDLSVVVPAPGRVQVPLAYPVGDDEMAAFTSVWIDLARKDGTIQALYDHWILGRAAEPRTSRWSILRDVLHWVD